MTTTLKSQIADAAISGARPIPQPDVELKPAPVPTPKTKRTPKLMAALAGTAALIAGGSYWQGRGHESTDDAQVEGHVVNVATRIGGRVARVLVHDNQLVHRGQPLVQLEDDEITARIAATSADLAAAEAELAVSRAQLALTEKNVGATLDQARGGVAEANGELASVAATVVQARADIASAQARANLTAIEQARTQRLLAIGASEQSTLDVRNAAHDQAVAALEQASARLAVIKASTSASAGGVTAAKARLASADTASEQLAVARANVASRQARVQQAGAALQLAQLNAQWATITAPVDGVVSRRSVEPGQMVDPARPLLALVPRDQLWIVANFKEDQLAKMQPGQTAEVKFDTFGGREFAAHVDSFANGTGARFALIPPDNATGNFIKVVQRVPVLIRLDRNLDVTLRPGMSAEVSVATETL